MDNDKGLPKLQQPAEAAKLSDYETNCTTAANAACKIALQEIGVKQASMLCLMLDQASSSLSRFFTVHNNKTCRKNVNKKILLKL